MYDIIIDVIVNGRTLPPADIPQAISEQIAAVQRRLESGHENGDRSGEIEYGGMHYEWSIRPCVYP